MKVGQLIVLLEKCNPDADVFIEEYGDKGNYHEIVEVFNDSGDIKIRDFGTVRIAGDGGPIKTEN
jgi:hypothetical protein